MELRRASFFTYDALLAAIIIVSAILMFSTPITDDSDHLNYFAQDSMDVLSELEVAELDNSTQMKQLRDSGLITKKDANRSVLEMIAVLWAEGHTEAARNMSSTVLGGVRPESFSYNLTMASDDENRSGEVMSSDTHAVHELTRYGTFVTGVDYGEVVRGHLTKLHFEKIDAKKTTAYAYFGGFIGQGNVSVRLALPPDLNSSQIMNASMELNPGDNFTLHINGNSAGYYEKGTAGGGYMQADRWDISSYSSLFSGGDNTVTLSFDNINKSFVGGGVLEVTYESRNYSSPYIEREEDHVIKTRHIPGVDGLINIYDSFYVPGSLNGMQVHLEYVAESTNASNSTFYMTIGNLSVYEDDNSTTYQEIDLTAENLSARGVDFDAMDTSTIPFRIGYENISFERVEMTREGSGDAALVTDVSGSMDDDLEGDWDAEYENDDDCTQAKMNDPDASKIYIARCLDKRFAQNMTNASDRTRVTLTSYESNLDSTLQLTDDYSTLEGEIEGYDAGGNTCTACGIWKAIDNLRGAETSTALIENKSVWKYSNQTPGMDASGNHWYNSTYNDSAWSEGPAIIGFGGQENTTLVTNESYFRKDFEVADLDAFLYPTLWVRSDDNARVYINGRLVDNDTVEHNGSYWNRRIKLYRERIWANQCESEAGWTHDANQDEDDVWENGIPSGGGYNGYSVNQDHTEGGKNAWCLPLSGGTTISDQTWLISPPINVSENPGYLEYWIWHDLLDWGAWGNNGLIVEISENGRAGPWSDMEQYTGHTDGEWKEKRIPLTGYANETIHLRFLLDPDYSWAQNKVCVDDLAITRDRNVSELLYEGTNTIAAHVKNNDSVSSGFDAELRRVGPRQRSMLIMSDGEANHCTNGADGGTAYCDDCSGRACCPDENGSLTRSCNDTSHGDAVDQAVGMACWAKERYNISIYSVFIGEEGTDGAEAMNLTAKCDDPSHFYQSSNVSGLQDIYKEIGTEMRRAWGTFHKQTVSVHGQLGDSELSADSYIRLNYTPANVPEEEDIMITASSEPFGNNFTNGSLYFPSDINLQEVMVSSYSEEYWTQKVSIDNGTRSREVFSLPRYTTDYFSTLGDPFMVGVPTEHITRNVTNTVTIRVGLNETNLTQASPDDRAFYTFGISSTFDSDTVGGYSDGCIWNLSYYDGSTSIMKIPADYNGTDQCSYTPTSITYEQNDSVDIAAYQLFRQLDFKNNGNLIVKPQEEMMRADTYTIRNVPSMIGPTDTEMRVWR